MPEGTAAKLLDVIDRTRGVIVECGKLLNRNRIFRDRMDGIGVITKEDAIAWGVTGPVGRSTGLEYDVRKDHPYLVYDRFDFDVPVGSVGDNFDRYMCRLEEIAAVDAHHRAGAGEDPGRARSWSTIRGSACPPRRRPTTRSRP